MKWSETGIKTLREKPTDTALPGHALLEQAGCIKKLSAGIFTYGPLFLRSIKKFEQIVREELNKIGAVEILMPMVQPKRIWEQSGRWELYADLLQKLTSRTGQSFCLGPTHEEVISDYVKNNINSYRDLPFCLYQIQTKFRDEIRPRFGLMRAKEFIMKDAYSFDLEEPQALNRYQLFRKAYQKIFSRLEVKFYIVPADSGEIGGNKSEEFLILAEHGETELLVTDSSAITKEQQSSMTEAALPPDGKPWQSAKGIEAGHIFYLGDKYSKSMELFYLNQEGKKQNIQMGCYGIGITRTLQAVVEQSHDKEGIVWPMAVAPCLVHLCLLDAKDQTTKEKAQRLYEQLMENNVDVFLDDRQEMPGVKFKDADLLGLPYRVNIGARDLKQGGKVECIFRKTKNKQKMLFSSAADYLCRQTTAHPSTPS